MIKRKIGVGHAFVGELEKKYVNMALDAGRLSQGEFVYKFENQFAKLHEQRYGTACNSGTSALHVALEALKEKYEMHYGMLSEHDSLSPYPWQWICEPWPWESDANFKLEKGGM